MSVLIENVIVYILVIIDIRSKVTSYKNRIVIRLKNYLYTPYQSNASGGLVQNMRLWRVIRKLLAHAFSCSLHVQAAFVSQMLGYASLAVALCSLLLFNFWKILRTTLILNYTFFVRISLCILKYTFFVWWEWLEMRVDYQR